jgi:hypothetical protein
MNDGILEEAERLFESAQAAPTLTEYEREQLAIKANYERLKAERLARESGLNGLRG